MKKFIKYILPPIFLDIFRYLRHYKYGWKGDYKSWEEPFNLSTKYDSNEVIKKVETSLLKVKNGEAVYERDGFIFDSIQYSWPLLAALMYASTKSDGRLSLIDFGGSLGSTYFQNRKFIDGLKIVSWNIIEQEKFFEIGKKSFENDRLKFFDDIEECISKNKPNILLLSSVLQYIEKPFELLDKLLEFKFEFIIIDRTQFSTTTEKIKLQVVPPYIYNASYPCWFLNEKKFVSYFMNKKYRLIEEFEALGGSNNEYFHKGFIFEKI